jgi:aromatic ring-opening dioxygenase catalytic subunit (LigB family)
MAERMPALFIGHGNPMNTLLVNPYTQPWASIGATLPKPKAILSVSAHWYIEDAAVAVSTAPSRRQRSPCGRRWHSGAGRHQASNQDGA